MKKIKMLIRNIKKYWFLVLSGLLCSIALTFFLLTERNVRILNDMNPSLIKNGSVIMSELHPSTI